MAVAAASILARDEFLDWLAARARRLPKGGGVAAGRRGGAARSWREGGAEALRRVAKLHFATTERVLGG